jgi:hypothetical protein
VATPAGTYTVKEATGREDAEGELPFSVTFLGRSQSDAETLEIAHRFQEYLSGKGE